MGQSTWDRSNTFLCDVTSARTSNGSVEQQSFADLQSPAAVTYITLIVTLT